MPRCLVQSRATGRFVVPMDGYIGYTQSLRHALRVGLLDEADAADIVRDHADEDSEVVMIYPD